MRQVMESAAQESGFRFSMPAPVGGWNARDNIAQMPVTDALILDNFFPSTTDVQARFGSTQVAELPGGQNIHSLLSLALQNGTFKRFAGTTSGLWDVTAGGSIAAVSSAGTASAWEHINYNVGGISYLWVCAGDGVNDSRIYNGTTSTWTNLNATSTPALTGITSNLVSNLSIFKNRIILCERNTLKFYYGPLLSIAGAFTAFDLGQVFKRGGYLVATANWTIDGGSGIDDHFVAITSEGEVAVYKGSDPSAASTFSLVGVFEIGKPTGKRCFVHLAGDLGVLTEQGLWPLSRALMSATVDRRVALTDKIQQAFNAYYKIYGTLSGWQPVLLPKGPAILVNVPLSSLQSYQFVMNTQTGAWCRFTDWNATCLMVQDGKLYFALGRKVHEAWTGLADNSAGILCSAATAFSYGPAKARGKHIKLVKPILQSTSQVAIGLALDTDFQQRLNIQTIASLGTPGGTWNTAIWDSAIWPDGNVSINKWKKVRHKPGGAFGLRLRIQPRNITVTWAATDFIGEVGGLAT